MTDIRDDIWTEALEEAYASSPIDDTVLHTLELRHPTFLDEEGNPTAVRVVRDQADTVVVAGEGDEDDVYGHMLTIEDCAPMDAGESVPFVACMFDFDLPPQTDGAPPSIQISLDNVTREVTRHLDAAGDTRAALEVTYREYLASDPTIPQFIISGLTITKVRSTVFRVTAEASFMDLLNKVFPGKSYRPHEFTGLLQ